MYWKANILNLSRRDLRNYGLSLSNHGSFYHRFTLDIISLLIKRKMLVAVADKTMNHANRFQGTRHKVSGPLNRDARVTK